MPAALFLAAALAAPVRADSAALYGAIGATIGHELTHGFDDEGRHYDGRGNLAAWWTPQDRKAFEDRAQGFVDDYSKFVTTPGARLNGRQTLGENIADNGGLILAYLALKPGSNEDARRFFLSYGQRWCMNQTEAFLKEAGPTPARKARR